MDSDPGFRIRTAASFAASPERDTLPKCASRFSLICFSLYLSIAIARAVIPAAAAVIPAIVGFAVMKLSILPIPDLDQSMSANLKVVTAAAIAPSVVSTNSGWVVAKSRIGLIAFVKPDAIPVSPFRIPGISGASFFIRSPTPVKNSTTVVRMPSVFSEMYCEMASIPPESASPALVLISSN